MLQQDIEGDVDAGLKVVGTVDSQPNNGSVTEPAKPDVGVPPIGTSS